MKPRASISAMGMYVPDKVVSNDDFSKTLDTSDEWIRDRTGIRQRRIAAEDQANSDLSVEAIQKCLASRGIGADELDLIIVATVTPDMFFPSTACVIQDKIGACNAWGFDLSGACSGFLYALATGAQFIETGHYQKVMVVGTDVMSSILDFEDRTTCVLFGDGSGAVLLEPSGDPAIGLIDFILRSDGGGGRFLYMPAGGSLNPSTHETVEGRMHYVHQNGRNVFKFAVKHMSDISAEILSRNGFTAEDLRLFVPHQANLRIIQSSVERLGLKPEQVAINIDRYANTTAATIPMGLCEYSKTVHLNKGDLVLLASFGAGFTWGSVLLRWGDLVSSGQG